MVTDQREGLVWKVSGGGAFPCIAVALLLLGSAMHSALASFQPPVHLPEMNRNGWVNAKARTADGLAVYLEYWGDIAVCTRSTPLEAFGPPEFVPELVHAASSFTPVITSQSLTLMFSSMRSGHPHGSPQIWVTTRSAVTEPFSPPLPLTDLHASTVDARYLSPSGDSLWYRAGVRLVTPMCWHSVRPAPGAPFDPGTNDIPSDPYDPLDMYPSTFAPDELAGFWKRFCPGDTGHHARPYVSFRASRNDEFLMATPLPYPFYHGHLASPANRSADVLCVSFDERVIMLNTSEETDYSDDDDLGTYQSIDFAGLGPDLVAFLLGKRPVEGIGVEPCDANSDHGLDIGDLMVMLDEGEQITPYSPPYVRTRESWFRYNEFGAWPLQSGVSLGMCVMGREMSPPYYPEFAWYFVDVKSRHRSLSAISTRLAYGSGDVDLYVRKDALPTTGTYDFYSAGPNSAETVIVDETTSPALTPGRWYILIHNYLCSWRGLSSGFEFTATLDDGGGTTGSAPVLSIDSVEAPRSGRAAVALRLGGHSYNTAGVGATILYDPAILSNPTVELKGIARRHSLLTHVRRPGELHVLVFSEDPTGFIDSGPASFGGNEELSIRNYKLGEERAYEEGKGSISPSSTGAGLAAARIARLEFDIAPMTAIGTTTSIRLSDIYPAANPPPGAPPRTLRGDFWQTDYATADPAYIGVRGTTICDTEGKTRIPAMVDGTITIRRGRGVGLVAH